MQKLKHPIFDVQITVKVDDLPSRTILTQKHFAIKNETYIAESSESYHFFDNGANPAFIKILVQCWVNGNERFAFTIRYNDIWSPTSQCIERCFGDRPAWAKGISLQRLQADDLETRLYLVVKHNREAQRITLSQFSFVFPHDFSIT